MPTTSTSGFGRNLHQNPTNSLPTVGVFFCVYQKKLYLCTIKQKTTIMSELILGIKLFSDLAHAPKKSEPKATGYDLRCMLAFSVPAFSAVKVPLGFAMEIVGNGVLIDAQIRPRSSVSAKGINIPTGTIEMDYRGELIVCLQNITPKVIDFQQGEKIAQLVFGIYTNPDVQIKTELSETERGAGGFGSTGIF